MPKYIFTYHQPQGYTPAADATVMAAWGTFFEGIASSVIDPGQPVFERRTVGDIGTNTQLNGYTVVEAADFEQAMSLAEGCPTVANGGGVQVGELAELPPDHIASRLRDELAQA